MKPINLDKEYPDYYSLVDLNVWLYPNPRLHVELGAYGGMLNIKLKL